jgi:hypothetical protein
MLRNSNQSNASSTSTSRSGGMGSDGGGSGGASSHRRPLVDHPSLRQLKSRHLVKESPLIHPRTYQLNVGGQRHEECLDEHSLMMHVALPRAVDQGVGLLHFLLPTHPTRPVVPARRPPSL